MPPKKAAAGGGDKVSKKTEMKKKEKVIEDKTFGLKNKKGGKNQKFIAQVEKQVKSGGDPKTRRVDDLRIAEKKKKEEDRKREEEEKKLLFAPIVTQKVESGVDPKSMFCAFFKQGLCKKGDKCKFSHDPSVERKAAKRNVYEDVREQETMDDWDEEKLEEVVRTKHGQEQRANQTDKICKHFLDALENSKYGWFWACPNGGNSCMYRHALPPGFMLKKDKKREEKKEEVSMEELVESKRSELSAGSHLTPVTLESFLKWKKRKLREKADSLQKEADKKKDKAKAGLTQGLSGREMFSFNPTMVQDEDDDDDGEAVDMTNREADAEDGVKVHDIKFDEYGIMEDGVDDSTEAKLSAAQKSSERSLQHESNGIAGPIDEDLFDDEDLDELEEGLESLDV